MALCRTFIRKRVVDGLVKASQATPRIRVHTTSKCVQLVHNDLVKKHDFVWPKRHAASYFRWKRYAAIFAAVGGAAALMKYSAEDVHCSQAQSKQRSEIWKDIKITLYQYQTCPFCTKARTFLTYYQIPFEIVEVHPIFKKEIKFSKSKKVPIVTLETEESTYELQDSSLIISALSTYMADNTQRVPDIMKQYPKSEIVTLDGKKKEIVLNKYWIIEEEPDIPSVLHDDPRQKEADWREWTDEHLVHLISPNVYRTYIEAYQAFDLHVKMGKFSGTWEGLVAKIFGSIAMWLISKKLKKKYKMQDDVRIDLYHACNDWHDAMGKGKFMGGDEPDLADLSVYAVLSVMEGLVSFDDVIKYTKIKPWYFRVKKAVEARQA